MTSQLLSGLWKAGSHGVLRASTRDGIDVPITYTCRAGSSVGLAEVLNTAFMKTRVVFNKKAPEELTERPSWAAAQQTHLSPQCLAVRGDQSTCLMAARDFETYSLRFERAALSLSLWRSSANTWAHALSKDADALHMQSSVLHPAMPHTGCKTTRLAASMHATGRRRI
jgi:hypothetical protein